MSNENKDVRIDEQEFAVAEKEASASTGTYTHKFKKPFTYMGKTFNELTFDWSKLRGSDSISIEDECQALGNPVVVATLHSRYLIRVAAKACTEKIGSDAFELMPLADYNGIKSAARSFLLPTE